MSSTSQTSSSLMDGCVLVDVDDADDEDDEDEVGVTFVVSGLVN